ncbi:RNA-binding protein 48 [Branchiostoma belcheri]|nr:RNA-binding protein 48 [Branchiostoma belcheri]
MAAPMDKVAEHHKQKQICALRPAYRQGRRDRAVKVYTVNQESRYLLVQGVPAIGVTEDLVRRFALYGAVQEYRVLHEYPAEEFTQAYWIKFDRLQAARVAKRKLDEYSFFGGVLHVSYAPEFETVDDTREKLGERRILIANKTRGKRCLQKLKHFLLFQHPHNNNGTILHSNSHNGTFQKLPPSRGFSLWLPPKHQSGDSKEGTSGQAVTVRPDLVPRQVMAGRKRPAPPGFFGEALEEDKDSKEEDEDLGDELQKASCPDTGSSSINKTANFVRQKMRQISQTGRNMSSGSRSSKSGSSSSSPRSSKKTTRRRI